MSYCRWSDSEWYIFWHCDSGPTKEEQNLSVWYSMDSLNQYTYQQIKTMLADGTFATIPGYEDCSKYGKRDLLDALEEFCLDVESATDIPWRTGAPYEPPAASGSVSTAELSD
jgi:hypothetical protein